MTKCTLLNNFTRNSLKHSRFSSVQQAEDAVKVYNSLSGTVEPLVAKRPLITWYSCGPTVYDDAHVGHAICYIRQDCIRRVLEKYQSKPIVFAMGVTDVDDKIIKRSKLLGENELQLAKKHEVQFFECLKMLNVKKPDIVLRVSDCIPKIIHIIQSIIAKGHAYVTETGNVFFDVNSFPQSGKFDPLKIGGRNHEHVASAQEAVARNSATKFHPEKRNRADFALWKSRISDEIFWDSPWGKGRPGWHIECSAFCDIVTGGVSNLTIHSGGTDLKFPHHNNEMCQSEAYYSADRWVDYFIHIGNLYLSESGQKMSKSLKNFTTVSEFLSNIGSADELRVTSLRRHYRSTIMYSEDDLILSRNILKTIAHGLHCCEDTAVANTHFTQMSNDTANYTDIVDRISIVSRTFDLQICSDFNFPEALEVLVGFCERLSSNKEICLLEAVLSRQFISSSLDTLGITLSCELETSVNEHILTEQLKSFRETVRSFALGKHLHTTEHISKEDLKTHSAKNSKLLEECDRIRSFIDSLNYRKTRDDRV